MIEEALKPYLTQGVMPPVLLWGKVYIHPYGTKMVAKFKAIRFNGWEGNKVQVAVNEVLHVRKVTPAHEDEEDGEVREVAESVAEERYYQLEVEPLDSRTSQESVQFLLPAVTIEGIDLLYANYEIPFPDGVEKRRVVAGMVFRSSMSMYRGVEASFAVIHKQISSSQMEMGPASHILANLPGHFEPLAVS